MFAKAKVSSLCYSQITSVMLFYSCLLPLTLHREMAPLLLLMLSFVSAPLSATLAARHTCKSNLASLAVISCQESVQSPTPSCCDALLYAVDVEPQFEGDKGACCLCKFMVARDIPFNLPSVYRSCHGKDSDTVVAWPTYMKNCDGMSN